MGFIEPITIKQAIESVDQNDYILPAIQREFRWSQNQIIKLFDSLLRDYPIGSFLFWEIKKENADDYDFYEFMRDYHEKDNYLLKKAQRNLQRDLTAVLDGQQRLTSLYIGLKGSYSGRTSRMRKNNPLAYVKRILHINLLGHSEEYDLKYDLKFLSKNENWVDEDTYWMPLSYILIFKDFFEVQEYLFKNINTNVGNDKMREASSILTKLFTIIHIEKPINFFLEKSNDLDKVLNIFTRINNGGTVLSYSDLLLSIATAQWKHRDAREVINGLVTELNSIGDGFSIDKDFVLKSCLVLSNFKDIGFKVYNFNKKNMLFIEENWESFAKSLRLTLSLVSELGYSSWNFKIYNALVPIAYYIYNIGNPDAIVTSSKYLEDRKKIHNWLIRSVLKKVFGGQPNLVIQNIRGIVKVTEGFPLKEIIKEYRGTTKSISFDQDDLEMLLNVNYNSVLAHSILSLISPWLDFKNYFHQDHIYPQHFFTLRNLKSVTNPQFYLENYNTICNLQFLDSTLNLEKSSKDPKEWLQDSFQDENSLQAYKLRNYIPDIELTFNNFEEFVTKRRILLLKVLATHLFEGL